jgi:hypothetical protein
MKKSLLLFALIFNLYVASAQDTLYLKNNDVIVGEVKDLAKGVLTFETDYSDNDFTIKWLEVAKIKSTQTYIFTFSTGERKNGTITTDPANPENVIIIDEYGEKTTYKINQVVYMKSVKGDFLSKLTASVDIGYTFTKSQNSSSFTTRAGVGYLTNVWGANGTFNMVRTQQDSVADIRRTEGGLSLKLFLYRDIFAMASANYLQNDEMKLSLRSIYKAGIGDYFVNSNRIYLIGTAGIAFTNENYVDTLDTRSSGEGFASLELNLFDVGDLSLQTTITLYPNLTTLGRYRTDFTFDVKYDFPLDLYIKFGTTYNYDSNPVEGASKSDYVIQTTLGWSWN